MSFEGIQKLIDGNKQFREKYFGTDRALYENLTRYGQKPKTMVIACSDSRVDPAIIFNCQPGELFMVRNVANLVPPQEGVTMYHGTSAALEFGVRFLGVEDIIILGHTQCGGIQALLHKAPEVWNQENGYISKWLDIARPAYQKVIDEHSHASFDEQVVFCEKYALLNSLKNLSSFEWIAQSVAAGKLALHAWYFDLKTGKINRYNSQAHKWHSVE